MTLLMHVCCGPCTIYPLTVLRDQGYNVEGYFFNPNIHPFREFKKRTTALDQLCEKMHFPALIDRRYGLQDYLRQVVFNEKDRCRICYAMRLEATAAKARETKAEAFTTTLLYSRYQNHNEIRRQAEALAEKYAVPFHYQDFRIGWQQGIDDAIAMDLYRQPYCGCIYSEQERYDKRLRRKENDQSAKNE